MIETIFVLLICYQIPRDNLPPIESCHIVSAFKTETACNDTAAVQTERLSPKTKATNVLRCKDTLYWAKR